MNIKLQSDMKVPNADHNFHYQLVHAHPPSDRANTQSSGDADCNSQIKIKLNHLSITKQWNDQNHLDTIDIHGNCTT